MAKSNQKDTNQPPIIIVKKIKKGGHAHHGGAWKVAYADFVTAMMAFFLLLWLLNATTDEQKKAIADYFSPSVITGGNRGNAGLFGGTSISSKASLSANGGATVPMPKPDDQAEEDVDVDDETIKAKIAEQEKANFEQAAEELKQAIAGVPDLADLKENLLVDQTPEGLRIQLVDREKVTMFELGSAKPLPHTEKLLALVTQAVSKLPNKISVTGHTDATPYRGGVKGYSNWELSADRANASRRTLVESGIADGRIMLVQGKAETDPLIVEEPNSPRNRRISIVLLNNKEAPVKGVGADLKAGAKAGAGAVKTPPPPKSPAQPAQSLRAPTGLGGESQPRNAPPPAR
jgi:chemotaxis protein MotB